MIDMLKGAPGVALLAILSLGCLTGVCGFGGMSGAEYVDAMESWSYIVFGGAAVSGFRDWKKSGGTNGNSSGSGT